MKFLNSGDASAERAAIIHEDLSRKEEIHPASDRSFGFVFGALFVAVALAPLWRGHAARPWALIVAALCLAISLAYPGILQPLNTFWMRLGRTLQSLTNPIVMGLLFFSTIIPIAVLVRLRKRDPLRLRWDSSASSYWIHRIPPGARPESMRDQF